MSVEIKDKLVNLETVKMVKDRFDGSINELTTDDNRLKSDVTNIKSKLPFGLGIDINSNYGYIDASGKVVPFYSGIQTTISAYGHNINVLVPKSGKAVLDLTVRKIPGKAYTYDLTIKKNNIEIYTETFGYDYDSGDYKRPMELDVNKDDTITITGSDSHGNLTCFLYMSIMGQTPGTGEPVYNEIINKMANKVSFGEVGYTPEFAEPSQKWIDDINTAGATNKAAVTAEGARVLATIPDDYTTEITTLDGRINTVAQAVSNLHNSDKCTIQWYRGGYATSTGKWSGNSLYSEDSDTSMMHPAPLQMLEGDVIPCPDGYTVGIAVYKNWHNADDFEYDSFIGRRSTPYTIPSSKSGYWFMPAYKTANGDILCDKNYSFKAPALELMRTITPMLCNASSYYSMTKRINALENQMESMTKLIQSLTGGVTEKFDQFSTVQYKKKNIDPDNADGFGIWLMRNTNFENMNGIPDVSGHAMLINITQKSYYSTVQFYIMSSGEHAGTIYMRTKNKKSWSGIEWSVIGGISNE